VAVGIAGQIDRPFLAQIHPSLTEVSHVAWRGASLEMTGGTKGGAQRAHTLKAYVQRGGSPVTTTPIYHLPCSHKSHNDTQWNTYLVASSSLFSMIRFSTSLPMPKNKKIHIYMHTHIYIYTFLSFFLQLFISLSIYLVTHSFAHFFVHLLTINLVFN
jgi:hypothetical protein